MKKLSLLFLLTFIFSFGSIAQDLVGTWKSFDDETGKAKSLVKIYKGNDGKYYGKIVKLFDPNKQDSKCDKCEGENKGQRILGMVIIVGMTKSGNEYSKGTILDPNNGTVYDCKLWFDSNDVLKVRGYWGWFFRTQTWKRVES